MYIYNEALGKMQGYTPDETYIIGRKTLYHNNKIKYETTNALEKVGTINYTTNDKMIIEKCKEAIFWYRIVNRKGALWKLDPPTVVELYPNMTVDSGKWNGVKKDLAVKLGDVTLLWNCGIKHRENMFNNSILSFYSEDLKVDMLGLGEKTSKIVENIIQINSKSEENNLDTTDESIDDYVLVNDTNKLIIPEKISDIRLKEGEYQEFFVDFETFTDICQTTDSIPKHNSFNMIFMIGVGWYEHHQWNFKQFISNTPDYIGEQEIINNFYNFISKRPKSVLYHWKADESFWKKAIERSLQSRFENLYWFDLMQVFLEHKIAIKGVYDYGLKSIATMMNKYNMISTSLEAECNNGMMAMIKAWQCYQKYKQPTNAPIMKDIARYNQYDCKIMCNILQYIRNKMLV